jgi:hypothetical protein
MFQQWHLSHFQFHRVPASLKSTSLPEPLPLDLPEEATLGGRMEVVRQKKHSTAWDRVAERRSGMLESLCRGGHGEVDGKILAMDLFMYYASSSSS